MIILPLFYIILLKQRFQVSVSSDLSRGDEEVVELRLPMTESMDQIQQALIECMEVTLSEVKKSNSKVKSCNILPFNIYKHILVYDVINIINCCYFIITFINRWICPILL